jgi:uncharacterized protein (DUF1330 family)
MQLPLPKKLDGTSQASSAHLLFYRSVFFNSKGLPMSKGYWIVRVDISNSDQYQQYIAANAQPLAQFGAKFLVRGGVYEAVEGGSRSRNAVIEFPSYQAALDCWKSPGYQHAKSLRDGVCTIDLIVIEGYDGPQPAQ